MRRKKPLQSKLQNRLFTLIEVMIALVLLVIISGVISHKMYGAIEKKKFQSDVERLKVRMIVAQKLAVSMQADWSGKLSKEGENWVFSVQCDEVTGKKFKPLHFSKLDVTFDGKKVKNRMAFDFFASGHTSPEGVISFTRNSQRSALKTANLFQREGGTKSGPTHPIN